MKIVVAIIAKEEDIRIIGYICHHENSTNRRGTVKGQIHTRTRIAEIYDIFSI